MFVLNYFVMSGGSLLTVEAENSASVLAVSHGPVEIPQNFTPTQTTSASNIASGPTRSNVRCSCPNCQNGINRTTNSGKKVHNCHIKKCGKTYTKTSHLRSHLRVHFGERPYECQYCDRAFTRSDERRRHVRIHTGEKNHQCGVCGKWFSRSDHLKKHEKTHENPRRRNGKVCAKIISEDKQNHVEVYVPTYGPAEAEEQSNNENIRFYLENFSLDLVNDVEQQEVVPQQNIPEGTHAYESEFTPIGMDGINDNIKNYLESFSLDLENDVEQQEVVPQQNIPEGTHAYEGEFTPIGMDGTNDNIKNYLESFSLELENDAVEQQEVVPHQNIAEGSQVCEIEFTPVETDGLEKSSVLELNLYDCDYDSSAFYPFVL